MTKKKTNIPLISFWIILFIAGGFLLKPIIQETGFELISASKPDFTGDLQGQFWVVSAKIGGDISTITVSDFKRQTGAEPEHELKIESDLLTEEVIYPITQKTDVDIFDYDVIRKEAFFSPELCPSNSLLGSNGIKGVRLSSIGIPTGTVRICIVPKIIAVVKRFDSPRVNFGIKLTMISNNIQTTSDESLNINNVKVGSQNIISGSQPVIELFDSNGKQRVRAALIGLSKINEPPSTQGLQPLFLFEKKQWKSISSQKISSYNTARQLFESRVNSLSSENRFELLSTTLTRYINEFNTQLNIIETTEDKISEDLSTNIENPLSDNEAKFKLKLTDRQIFEPIINMRIDATYIGFKIEVGQPKFSNIICKTTPSGDKFIINGNIKNIGKGSDIFDLSTTNCFENKFNFENTGKLNSGESISFKVDLTSDFVGEKECTVTAKSRAKPSLLDTIKTNCKTEIARKCNPDEIKLIGNTVGKCKQDGTDFITIKSCDKNLIADKNDPTGFICPGVERLCTPNVESVEGNSVYKCNNDGQSKEKLKECSTPPILIEGEFKCKEGELMCEDTFFIDKERAIVNEEGCTSLPCSIIGFPAPKKITTDTCIHKLSFAGLLTIIISVVLLILLSIGGLAFGLRKRNKSKGGKK